MRRDRWTFEDALRIVDERGKAMQYAAELAPGGMSAVLGLEASAIRDVVDRRRAQSSGKRVQLANFNSPTQIVISGDLEAVRAAGDAMLAAGAKRVVPLNVSGAWHSRLDGTGARALRGSRQQRVVCDSVVRRHFERRRAAVSRR